MSYRQFRGRRAALASLGMLSARCVAELVAGAVFAELVAGVVFPLWLLSDASAAS